MTIADASAVRFDVVAGIADRISTGVLQSAEVITAISVAH
jgi:hypothetical protein